jgi:hypothetical protein
MNAYFGNLKDQPGKFKLIENHIFRNFVYFRTKQTSLIKFIQKYLKHMYSENTCTLEIKEKQNLKFKL